MPPYSSNNKRPAGGGGSSSQSNQQAKKPYKPRDEDEDDMDDMDDMLDEEEEMMEDMMNAAMAPPEDNEAVQLLGSKDMAEFERQWRRPAMPSRAGRRPRPTNGRRSFRRPII